MAMGDVLARLRCPVCRSAAPRERDAETLECPSCQARFPIAGGVPALVADPAALDAQLAEARAVNPAWYQSEQPVESISPWRHHLKKRRLYVESRIRRELARRGKSKAQALLDLGCGDGTNLLWLGQFAERLYGSDYNAVRLARAKARPVDATIFLADILDYPAFDGAFDVIFFNHVLEHIPDDGRALETVRRILAPGGLLVLGVPNEGSWWWQLAYKRAPDVLATTDHVHFYTAKTVTARLKQAGFRIDEVHHLGWGPPDWQLDGQWRQHKFLDDLFEAIGRVALPRQASSLYVLAS
jgi:SAM-dependent methyltransferase